MQNKANPCIASNIKDNSISVFSAECQKDLKNLKFSSYNCVDCVIWALILAPMTDLEKLWFFLKSGIQLYSFCLRLFMNNVLQIWRIRKVRKIGSLCFYAFFWRETKLLVFQWQAAAKTAQNFDPYLWQNHWIKYVYFKLNII